MRRMRRMRRTSRIVDDRDRHVWMKGWLCRRLICRLSGHELVRTFEPGRIYLRCTSCPYETPGWRLKESRTPATRHQVRPALILDDAMRDSGATGYGASGRLRAQVARGN